MLATTLTKQAFIYCRVSGRAQVTEGNGLDSQEDVCRAYAKQHGYEVIRVFQEVKSGAYWRDRPALLEMLDLVRARAIDVVILSELSRLSRNNAHVAVLMDEARHHDVKFLFNDEVFEDGAVGQLILNAKGFAAEIERERIAMRTQAGLERRVNQGMMRATRFAPYGYKWSGEDGKKTTFLIVPEEADVLRGVYEELSRGGSCRAIADRLNREGVSKLSGGYWRSSNLAKLLRNPIYKGEPHAYRYKGRHDQRVARERRGERIEGSTENDVLPGVPLKGGAPAIVSAEMWQSAIDVIEGNQKRATRSTKNLEESLLRGGFVVCGYCGHFMQHKTARSYIDRQRGKEVERTRPRVYFCDTANRKRFGCPSHEVKGECLDEVVWSHIVEQLSSPELIQDRLSKRTSEDPTRYERETIERQLGEVNKKLTNIRRSIASIEDEDFQVQLIKDANDFSKRKNILLEEQELLNARFEQWAISQHEIVSVGTWVSKVKRTLTDSLTTEQKRMALSALGVTVRTWKKDHQPQIVVEWSLPSGEVEEVVLVVPTGHPIVGTPTRTRRCTGSPRPPKRTAPSSPPSPRSSAF